MKRLYCEVFLKHLAEFRQMLFVMGPRQSGKTTATRQLGEHYMHHTYLNWDNINHRDLILQGPASVANFAQLSQMTAHKPLIIFDEIHKFRDWRDFLKGFYDTYPNEASIIVTGSAKLNVFNRGGDSLMGRYFPFRFHPLTLAEITQAGANVLQEYWDTPNLPDKMTFELLWKFGGYPDPFLKQSETFSKRWKTLRTQQIFEEDIRDLTRIQEIDRLELLMEKLKHQAGQLCSYQSFSKALRVSDVTVKTWLDTLQSLYYCFSIKPWSKNVTRSLLKEPKYYLWDWSLCVDDGARAENMMALHLLKAVDFWNDIGLGDYSLYFVRDKEKREVDFLVTKNDEPWMLVEVKLSDKSGISPSLHYFNSQLKPKYAFQVVFNMDYVNSNCFAYHEPKIVPAKTFLSQLV